MKASARGIVIRGLVSLAATSAAATVLAAGKPDPRPVLLAPNSISVLRVGTPAPHAADACEEYATHTTHQFINQPAGTPVIMQGGFAESEVFAASYVLPASAFPIRILSMEALFASIAPVPTTTEWSVLVWEGLPNSNGLVQEFNSDGVEIPHLTMPAAFGGQAQATVVQMLVDPNDPEQIIITNAGGSNTFSIGFRIDNHNNQISNPCVSAPPSSSNAFPATYNDGQQALTGNWLKALNCGPFGCPPNGGWITFQGLSPGICRPTGDWILRAQWEPTSCGGGCYADCSGDQALTVADFACFQTRFVGAEPYADCNADQQLTIADFSCFQNKFVQGCP